MSKRIPCRIVDLPSSIPVVEVGDAGKGLLVETSTSNKALPVRMSTAPGALRVSGLFTPASLPNLAAWYSADSGVLNSISPDVPATVGQTIRRWSDRSGNGRHLDQGTLLNQPTLASDGVLFTAASAQRFASAATFDLPQPCTIFAVWRGNSISDGAQRIFDWSGFRLILFNTSGFYRLQQTEGNTGNIVAANTSVNSAVYVFNSTSSAGYINATSGGAGTIGTSGGTGNLVVGSNNNQLAYMDGRIMELAFYSSALTDSQLRQLMSYAAGKYGTLQP